MDVDLLKSATEEDQMEMMMMMHHHMNNHHANANNINKFTEFGGTSFPDMAAELQSIDFTTSSGTTTTTTTTTTPPSLPMLSSSPTTLLSSHPSFSFMNSAFHEHSGPHRGSGGELSGGGGAAGVTAFSSPLQKRNNSSMAAMREMIFRIAAMQPIHIDPESVKPPKRRNVKISKDPQSVAARHRRERISERIRILQRLVPGGTKMDTASMLDEAIHYVKFLKTQVQSLEHAAATRPPPGLGFASSTPVSNQNYNCLGRSYQQNTNQMMFSSPTQMLS